MWPEGMQWELGFSYLFHCGNGIWDGKWDLGWEMGLTSPPFFRALLIVWLVRRSLTSEFRFVYCTINDSWCVI